MSRFFPKFVNWRRLIRFTSGAVVLGGSACAVGTITTAAVGVYHINSLRRRNFTDEYHLNPEILRMPYRHVEFSSTDGIPLRGWWIPATVDGKESKRIVILMHPYNNHKSNLLGVASGLWGRGYSIFMFDFRSFSKEKVRQSIGFLEQNDAIAAINYVLEHYCDEIQQTTNENENDNNEMNSNNNDNNSSRSKWKYNANDDENERIQVVLMGASMGGL